MLNTSDDTPSREVIMNVLFFPSLSTCWTLDSSCTAYDFSRDYNNRLSRVSFLHGSIADYWHSLMVSKGVNSIWLSGYACRVWLLQSRFRHDVRGADFVLWLLALRNSILRATGYYIPCVVSPPNAGNSAANPHSFLSNQAILFVDH